MVCFSTFISVHYHYYQGCSWFLYFAVPGIEPRALTLSYMPSPCCIFKFLLWGRALLSGYAMQTELELLILLPHLLECRDCRHAPLYLTLL